MLQIGRLVLLALVVWVAGCDDAAERSESDMPSEPVAGDSSMTDADRQRLREQRAVVEKLLANDASRQTYQTAAGKLEVIQQILDAKVFKPEQTYELQCLGVVLGDVFVQEMKMEWVMVPDAGGRDPAVQLPGTTIILYPLTMISKRIERGEQVDVFDLFNGLAAQIEQIKQLGN